MGVLVKESQSRRTVLPMYMVAAPVRELYGEEMSDFKLCVETWRISGRGRSCMRMEQAEVFQGDWVKPWVIGECECAETELVNNGVSDNMLSKMRYELHWRPVGDANETLKRTGIVQVHIPYTRLTNSGLDSFMKTSLCPLLKEMVVQQRTDNSADIMQ